MSDLREMASSGPSSGTDSASVLAVAARTTVPFYRFDARLGWPLGPPPSRPQVPYDDRDLQLAFEGRAAIPIAEPFGTLGGRTLPRGLAISSQGRIFLADPRGRVILTATVAVGPDGEAPVAPIRLRPLWPARPLPGPPQECDLQPTGRPVDPYTLVEPVDVALAPHGDLVIVDAGAARLLVLALPSARLRHLVDLAPGSPRSIAFDLTGRAHVADPTAGTVHRFDRLWRRDPGYPRARLSAPSVVAAADMAAARDTAAGGTPCGCGPAPRQALIHVLDGGALVGLDGAGRLVPTADLVAVPAGGDPPVLTPPPLVPSGDGFTWRDPALPGCRPMRIGGLAVTPDGRHQDTLLPLLALPRRVEVPRFGSFTTTALDSGRTAFAWDRITLEAVLPPQGRLVVSTLTSEVEVAFDRLATLPAERWSAPLAVGPGDVPEVLVQSRPGRYLWIKVELSGDGTASPVVSQLDVFGPRRSAMRYLPASFHQDPESVRFLDRFLSYFDTVYAEITAVNGEIAALFDPAVVPQEFLAWLGSWFDLKFLASWPEQVRRTMIAEAIGYYRMRGTVAGLKRILQWHTGLSDPMPQVIEHFRLPGGPVLIGGAELDVGTPAHAFTIVLPEHVASAGARTVLERLIASNIPAHTQYRLCLVRPGVTVAAQSTIGVDMTLPLRGGAPLGVAGLGTTFTTAPAEPGGAVHLPLQLGSRRQLCPPQPDGGPSC